jgi:TM2 domain-containing membrane protein YozV
MYDRAAAQFDIEKKSVLVAYLLWLLLGYVGAHRFYLGRIGSGLMMLCTAIVIATISFVSFGILSFLWVLMAIWWLIDALLIPGMATGTNSKIADRLFGHSRPF